MKRYNKLEGFAANGVFVLFMKRYNVLQFFLLHMMSYDILELFLLLMKMYDILERFCYLWESCARLEIFAGFFFDVCETMTYRNSLLLMKSNFTLELLASDEK